MLLLAAVGGFPRGTAARQHVSFRFAADQPSASSLCSTLTTNASLLALVAAKYPNSSLNPIESTANASVTQIWGGVCTSSVLVNAEAEQTNVSFGSVVYIADSNGSGGRVYSGSLFVQFTASWEAACPSGSTSYPSGYACHSRVVWTGNLSTSSVVGPVVSVVSDRFAACTLTESNASLVAAVDGMYPDASLRPNESTANQTIQVIWGQVCSSLPFYQAYTTYGSSSFGLSQWSSGGGTIGNGSTSTIMTLFLGFDFMWHASCPAGYPSGGDCQFDESWVADVAVGTWTGPNTTAGPDIGLGGVPPCCASPVALSAGIPTFVYAVIGASVALGVAVAVLTWRGARRAGPAGPPPGERGLP